jgi:hypothetical protein
MLRIRTIKAIDAATATAVSAKYWVGGARRIGILGRRANHSSGSTAFSVKGSLESYETGNGPADVYGNRTGGPTVTMTALNLFINNVENTNAEELTRSTDFSLSANGDAMAWLDPKTFVNWLEVTATETTDGTHTAFIVIEEEVPNGAGAF